MKKIYLILSVIFLGSMSAFAQGHNCATAVNIPGPGLYSADGPLVGPGGGNISSCGITGGTNADWYKFTPICDGVMSVSNNLVSTQPQIRLTIRSGSCASLACVAISPTSGNNGTINNVTVTGGTTYFLEWDDSWNGVNSGIPFDWTLDFTVNNAPTPSVSALVDQAFLTWIPFGLETGWDIQYGPSGFNLGSGTTVNVDSSQGNSFNVTGLLPETTYDYYIAIEGTGCYVGPITFTTQPLCLPPTGVTVNSLNNSAILSWQPGGSQILPLGAQPSWDLQYGPTGTPIGNNNMLYNNTVTSAAHNAQNLTSCTDYHMYIREICDATANPPLTSAWVGPVTMSTNCPCPEPSNLSATADPSNPFNYELSWTAGGSETSWNVQWGPQGFLFGTGTTVTAGTNPFLITGVTPDSDLDYYVQADCGNGDASIWVGPFTFTTNVFCPVPTGLGANNITTIAANIYWNVSGTTTDYTIEYGAPGFTLGTGTNYTLTSTTATLTGLTPDTEYCYYVQSNCGASVDSSSGWAGPFCFTTVAACPAPNNLSVQNLSFTSATLNWQPGASETMWDVEWGFPGFTPGNSEEQGSGTSNTTSDYYATGLNASAPYEFYVRAVCGGLDGNSNWAGPFAFQTVLSNDLPCGALELLVDGNINVHTNVGATVNGENAIQPPFTQAFNQHTASDATWWEDTWFENNNVEAPVWFKFKAPASGKVEVSTEHPITIAEETFAEIAVYEVGNCNLMSNFGLIAANSFSNLASIDQTITGNAQAQQTAIAGSKVLMCDLNPGQYYYILVDIVSETSLPKYDPGTFGISVTDIPAPNSGVATPLTVCSDGSSVNLFDAIIDNSTTTGVWYNPSALNPNFATPGSSPNISLAPGDGVYTFDYVIANACGADTVSTSITTVEGPNAGMDGYYSTCNTVDVILLNHLQGSVDLGGSWSDVNGQFDVTNGVFETYGQQYGTYSFYYIVAGNGACPADTAIININLNDNCLGVDESATSTLEMFPNPVNDVLTIANLSIEGNATVNIYDAQGKVVLSQDVSNHSGNYTIDMSRFESGMYVVELNSELSSEKVRVVKQ
jgi:hypothetical protein